MKISASYFGAGWSNDGKLGKLRIENICNVEFQIFQNTG